MSNRFHLRPAELSDKSAMAAVLDNAFQDNPFHLRCFPSSDPVAREQSTSWIENIFYDPASHLMVAEEATSSESGDISIAGWARWVRRLPPDPDAAPPAISENAYPSTGDPAFAARFFENNRDNMARIVRDQTVWFMSTIVVAKEYQRKGVASELMRFGVEKADEEGLMAYVNSSPEGKGLYERFGFRTVKTSDFGGGIVSDHMTREPKK